MTEAFRRIAPYLFKLNITDSARVGSVAVWRGGTWNSRPILRWRRDGRGPLLSDRRDHEQLPGVQPDHRQMSAAVRIAFADQGSRDTMISILRSAVYEVPGAVDRPVIEFPVTYMNSGHRGRIEARPSGEKGIEIEVVAE